MWNFGALLGQLLAQIPALVIQEQEIRDLGHTFTSFAVNKSSTVSATLATSGFSRSEK